ncbi:unnamed protein product [Anisakis simplex]|uniref:Uncharacterized protein n=1 Tax=Anisakis simplex TaxID=6269 RepID=A0A0M3KB83_ANISI|nr:unnamed protein product [Anisakis simplex]
MNTFKRLRKRFTEAGGSARRSEGVAEGRDETTTTRRNETGSREVQNHHPSAATAAAAAAEAHQNRQQHQDSSLISEPPRPPPHHLAPHAPNVFRDPFQQLPSTISAYVLLKLPFKRRTIFSWS